MKMIALVVAGSALALAITNMNRPRCQCPPQVRLGSTTESVVNRPREMHVGSYTNSERWSVDPTGDLIPETNDVGVAFGHLTTGDRSTDYRIRRANAQWWFNSNGVPCKLETINGINVTNLGWRAE